MREMIERVRAGDDVQFTQHGEVVAVLVSPESLRARRARSTTSGGVHDVLRMLREAADAPPAPAALSAEYAEELVGQIRRDRDAR